MESGELPDYLPSCLGDLGDLHLFARSAPRMGTHIPGTETQPHRVNRVLCFTEHVEESCGGRAEAPSPAPLQEA